MKCEENQQPANKNTESMSSLHYFLVSSLMFLVISFFFYFYETLIQRHIRASSEPSPLIGWELILVESPQEGAETCNFFL